MVDVVSVIGCRNEVFAGSTVYLLKTAAIPAIDCIKPKRAPENFKLIITYKQ